jgi:hypothetical protein
MPSRFSGRLAVTIAAALLVAAGLLALRFPVFLGAFDQWGWQINCGNGFSPDLTQAAAAQPASADFIGQCHGAVAVRRAWATPIALIGAVLITARLLAAIRHAPRAPQPTESTPPPRFDTWPDWMRR